MKKLWTRARTWTIVSLRRMCTTSREISKDSHFIAHYARLFMPHVIHLCHPRAAVLVLFAMLQEKCFIISKWREQFSFNILLDDTFFFKWRRIFIIAHIMSDDIHILLSPQQHTRDVHGNYETIVLKTGAENSPSFFFISCWRKLNFFFVLVERFWMRINLIKSTKLTFLCSFRLALCLLMRSIFHISLCLARLLA